MVICGTNPWMVPRYSDASVAHVLPVFGSGGVSDPLDSDAVGFYVLHASAWDPGGCAVVYGAHSTKGKMRFRLRLDGQKGHAHHQSSRTCPKDSKSE